MTIILTPEEGFFKTIPELREKIEKLKSVIKIQHEALYYYGWKIVPDSLNKNRTEITTETGKIARQAVAECDKILEEYGH